MTIESKLPDVGLTIFSVMSQLAAEHGAVNLSQGFPDGNPPPEVIEAAHRAIDGNVHQYAITWGAPRFREALARKQTRWMKCDIDPERNIVVTCGSTEAMMTAMMTACNPGDKVIIIAYAMMDAEEAKTFEPKVVFVDDDNKPVEISNEEHHGEIK